MFFTREFRIKMAELPARQKRAWLEDLAVRPASWRRDRELAEVARLSRIDVVSRIDRELGPFPRAHLEALLEVPRERFVREEDIVRSADDTPLPLDDAGLSTISAPHTYLLSFRLVDLQRGDALLELGSGSGYGAALASYITGPAGHVTTVEIDDSLYARAARELSHVSNVRVVHGDAVRDVEELSGPKKMIATFAIDEVPGSWLTALPEGGVLVAPVGGRDKDQRLMRFVRRGGEVEASDHGGVRYVPNRSPR